MFSSAMTLRSCKLYFFSSVGVWGSPHFEGEQAVATKETRWRHVKIPYPTLAVGGEKITDLTHLKGVGCNR